jgi:hypothetical protein
MSCGGSGNGGGWNNGTPNYEHAFDPHEEPELFRNVLTRRVIAFIIDLIVLSVPVALAYVFIAVFGLVTLGLGWVLFWLVWPATVVWAVIYYGTTLGGPRTRLFRARRGPCDPVLDLDLVPVAADPLDRAVQRPPAAGA